MPPIFALQSNVNRSHQLRTGGPIGMRTLIVLVTAALVACLSTLHADVISKEEVPKYIKMLQEAKAAKVRATAAKELGERGAVYVPDVKDAIEPLVNAVKKDKDAEVRKSAAEALGKIATDPKNIVPVLIDALKDKSDVVKMGAAKALGQYGVEARDALPALRELAKDSDKKLKQAANNARRMIAGKKESGRNGCRPTRLGG